VVAVSLAQARIVVPPEQWQKALEIVKQPPK
jgi:hypothetical protein